MLLRNSLVKGSVAAPSDSSLPNTGTGKVIVLAIPQMIGLFPSDLFNGRVLVSPGFDRSKGVA